MKGKVDFIIAGTQKGGTTALDYYLRQHDEICMAKQKEVHFFDSEKFFEHKPDYSEYDAYFDCSDSKKAMGEATPIYMYWKEAPRRMWEYNPSLKIIIILRNPIDRAYSNWNMEMHRNSENLSFWDAITTEDARCQEALPCQHRVYSYTDRGFYSEQLKRIWHYFPKHQTLILKNEDLRLNHQKTMETVCSFIGVKPMQKLQKQDVHSSPYINKMSDAEQHYLKAHYHSEIQELESLLGWDCSDWVL